MGNFKATVVIGLSGLAFQDQRRSQSAHSKLRKLNESIDIDYLNIDKYPTGRVRYLTNVIFTIVAYYLTI